MAHPQRGPGMMRPPPRGGMGPGRGGRPPPQIMPAPQGYYEPQPQARTGHMPPQYRGRGRGGHPGMGHHPHHPNYASTEIPGGYPGDMDSSEDITPESGSPEGSELTAHIPGGPPPPGQGYGFQPNQRAYFDGIMAENAHLRQENSGLRAQVAELAAGNELARGSWESGALADQLRDANGAIDMKNGEIFSLHAQMQELMAANQGEITKLKEELKASEGKVKEEAEKREKEIKKLQDDLDDVTSYLSMAKAEEGVVDDTWFKEELNKFQTLLRNWVRKHCKSASQMPETVEDMGVQARIKTAVPEFARLTMSNSRITVMQAVVQDIILKRIFNRYCVGLTMEDEMSLRSMEAMMTDAASHGTPTVTFALINRWRALSISLLTNVEPVKELSEGSIVDCCSEIESVVFSLIPGIKPRPGDAATRELIPLLASAVKIAHHFKGQRARIDVISPVNHIFDPEWMEDTSGLEDDADEELRGKMVGACAFPAVIKWGNEKGEDYHMRSVIYRAKVLCLLDND